MDFSDIKDAVIRKRMERRAVQFEREAKEKDTKKFEWLQSMFRKTGDHKWVRIAALNGFDVDWKNYDDEPTPRGTN